MNNLDRARALINQPTATQNEEPASAPVQSVEPRPTARPPSHLDMARNLVQQQSSAPAPASPQPQAPDFDAGTFNWDQLKGDKKLLEVTRRFASRNDPNAKLKTDDDVVNWLVDNRREVDVNTQAGITELVRSFNGAYTQTDLEDLKYLKDTWDKIPNAFERIAAGNVTSGLKAIGANVVEGLQDPVNYATGLIGMGAKTILGRTAIGAAADGALSAAMNSASQGVDIAANRQESFSPLEAGAAFGLGAATSAAPTAIGAAARPALDYLNNAVVKPTTGLFSEFVDRASPMARAALDKTYNTVKNRSELGDGLVYRVIDRNGVAQGTFGAKDLEMANNMAKGLPESRVVRMMQDENGAFVPYTDSNKLGWFADGAETSFWSRFTQNFRNDAVNSLASVNRAVKEAEGLGYSERVTATDIAAPWLNRMANAKNATAAENGYQIRFRDAPGEDMVEVIPGSQGLREILKPLYDQDPTLVDTLAKYRLEARLLEMETGSGRAAPINTGYWGSLAERLQTEQLHLEMMSDPKVGPLLRQYNAKLDEYNKNALDMAESAGIIDSMTRQRIESANLFYMPINRLVNNPERQSPTTGSGAAGSLRTRVTGVEEGTQSVFIDPLRTYADNMEALTVKATNNLLTKKTVDAIMSLPPDVRALYGREVDRKRLPNQFSADNVIRTIEDAFNKAGVDGFTYDSVSMGLRDAKDMFDVDFFTFWSQESIQAGMKGKRNIVSYFDNGELKFFEFTDPNLAKSMSQFHQFIDGAKRNALGQGVADAVSLFQRVITRDPSFVLATSLFTDTASSYQYSSRKLKGVEAAPGLGLVRNMGQDLAVGTKYGPDSDFYKQAVANGVILSGMNSNLGNTNVVKSFLNKYGIETDNILGLTPEQDQKLSQRLFNALSDAKATGMVGAALNRPAEIVETGPRLAEYKRLLDSGMDPVEAARKAVEGNIDFRHKGSNQDVTNLMSWIPFMRAVTNIYDKRVTTAAGAVKGNVDDRTRHVRMLVGTTLPIVGLAAYNLYYNYEAFQQLTPEDRALFHHIFIPGTDLHFKWRRTDDTAQAGVIIENLMTEMYREDKTTFDKLASWLGFAAGVATAPVRGTGGDIQDSLFAYVPFGVGTALDVVTDNKIGSAPLTPRYLQNAPKDQQFVEGRTAQFAIDNPLPGLSPIQTEFIMRDIFGPLAKYGFLASNLTDDKRAGYMNWRDFPVLERVIGSSQNPRQTRHSEEFYTLLQEATETKGRFAFLKNTGRVDQFGRAMQNVERPRNEALYGAQTALQKANQQISQLRQMQRQIYNTMPADQGDKIREQVDQINRDINGIMAATVLGVNMAIKNNKERPR